MKKLKTAVIGIGNMGMHHARIYSQQNKSELVGISDLENEKGSKIAFQYSANYYNNYLEMLKFEKPDCVSIATPTDTHCQIACDVLKYSSVLLEKPIALSETEAKKIINASKQSGNALMVGHIERFNPVITFLKKYLKEREEKVLSLNMLRLGVSPPSHPTTGVTLDLGIHDVDLIRYITEEEIIKGTVKKKNFGFTAFDDYSHLFLTTKNTTSSVVVNWFNPRKIRNVYAILEKSFVYINLITQRIEISEKDTDIKDFLATKIVELKKEEPLKLEIDSFINSVLKNTQPEISGEDGLKTLKSILDLEEIK